MKRYSLVVLLLLILQADVTGFLIVLSFGSSIGQNTFALLLTVDLLAFAMMTYVYRTEKLEMLPSKVWIVVGSALIVGLFFSSLIFT